MSRLATAFKHTKYSKRAQTDSSIPRRCVYQQLQYERKLHESCYPSKYVFEDHCNQQCPLDRPSIFEELLEKLQCLD